eukprot:6202158-Pleurochrysis_carterae.AAC.2
MRLRPSMRDEARGLDLRTGWRLADPKAELVYRSRPARWRGRQLVCLAAAGRARSACPFLHLIWSAAQQEWRHLSQCKRTSPWTEAWSGGCAGLTSLGNLWRSRCSMTAALRYAGHHA